MLVREAKYQQASTHIADLSLALGQREPNNAQLYYQCAQCFGRLSGGNLSFLNVTTQLAEHAVQLQPACSDYMAEVAFQQALRGDHASAIKTYTKAASSNDASASAVLGLIRCLIATGKLENAAQQIVFPNEIQNPQQRNAELLLLNAMLIWRREKNQALSLEKLDQASEAHKHDIATQPSGTEFYVKLNPPLMQTFREYLHCRMEPPSLA